MYKFRMVLLSLFCYIISVSANYPAPQVIVPTSVEQSEMFHLHRVQSPSSEFIDQERIASEQRLFKKYVVSASVAVSAVALMIIFYEIREAARNRDRALAQDFQKKMMRNAVAEFVSEHDLVSVPKLPVSYDLAKLVQKEANSLPVASKGFVSKILSGVTSFGWDCSRFVADSAQMLVSGVVVNGMYNFFHQKVTQAYADETVLWYVREHTKILDLVEDLKAYAVDYDLYASLLSCQMFNQDAQMNMKAFITDLLSTAQDHMNNEIFKDAQYFNFLLSDMKKKYGRKALELEKLQEYTVANIAKQHRALAQDHAQMLFTHDMNRRKDIAHMCNLLAQDIEKLIAFVMMHGDRYAQRVQDILYSCNAYLDHMELLLNATPDKMKELSQADCGMFTSIYEYEKILDEQIKYLHRYCRMSF